MGHQGTDGTSDFGSGPTGLNMEDTQMNERADYNPVALYARVSSDRQDVDLSVAAQLRKCLKTVLSSSWSACMGAAKVVFHEQREISKRPERPRMETAGTVDASSQWSRPANQVPGQRGGERYSLRVAHRVFMADAPTRPAPVADHFPLLPHVASGRDHGADS